MTDTTAKRLADAVQEAMERAHLASYEREAALIALQAALVTKGEAVNRSHDAEDADKRARDALAAAMAAEARHSLTGGN